MNIYLKTQTYLCKWPKIACIHLVLAFTLSGYASFADDLSSELSSVKTTSTARKNITGTVKDAQGLPMPSVGIKIKGSKSGTSTDENGVFNINLPTGDETLIVSYIGYKTQEIAVNGRVRLNIRMEEVTSDLNEIVVVGYTQQKRANVLGSVATVKAQDIQDLSVANLGAALRNTAPGIGVSVASGKPGSTASVNIRNPVTFSSSGTTDPLFVVDGIQLTKTDFDNLDATLVETVTFLKDAAASVYGSRGANGVVLVTTKRGKAGKTRVNYQGTYGISKETKFPDVLTGYEQAVILNGKYQGLINENPTTNTTIYGKELYTADELAYLKTHEYSWLQDTWENSSLSRHTLNVSGGTDKVTYFAGGNYYKENGNLKDLYVKKYGVRLGMNAKITDNLVADVTLGLDNSVMNKPTAKGVTENAETVSELFTPLLLTPGWVPMYINGLPVYSSTPGFNPYELQNSGSYKKSSTLGINLNASLQYTVPQIKGLSFKVQYGQTNRNDDGKQYYVPYNLYEFVRTGNHSATENVIFTNNVSSTKPITNGNLLYFTNGKTSTYQLNESATYNRIFGKHSVNLLVLAEQSESSGSSLTSYVQGQTIPGIDETFGFGLATTPSVTSSTVESGKVSYLTRLNYAFNDRYLLEGIFRADASPNFPANSRWGYFPSAALGWKISEEDFFKRSVPFINELKIRYQLGLTGNDQVSNYQYIQRYSTTTGYLFGTTYTTGLNNSTSPNSGITWEKALYNNFGIDGSILDRKLSFSLELYSKYEYDKLVSPENTFPVTSASSISDQNYGKLRTKGIELSFSYKGEITKDLKWNVSVNSGISDNKVIQKYYAATDTGYKYPIGRRTDSGIEGYKFIKIVKSQPELEAFMADHPGYTINGFAPKLGWMLFQDVNGDGKITEADKTRLVNRSGGRYGVGFNFGLSYKELTFSANVTSTFGGTTYYDKQARAVPTTKLRSVSAWNDAWSVNNPDGSYPAIDGQFVSEISEFWMRSATLIRINNMVCSYSLPQKVATRLGIQQLRLVLTGNNLWDIVNSLGYKYSLTNSATDYPQLRSYTLGLNLTL